MNQRLRKDAFKAPIWHVIIITLLAVGLVSIPLDGLIELFIKNDRISTYLGGILLRAILCLITVMVIFMYGFDKPLRMRSGIKGFIAVIPMLAISINNFPISTLLVGEMTITAPAIEIVLYTLYCLTIGAFEQLVFCGLVLPLFIYCFSDYNRTIFFAVVCESILFSLSHVFNIFAGAPTQEVLTQMGYSFLVGGMFAVSLLLTKSIYTAILFHFLYDFGGLVLSTTVGIAQGHRFSIASVYVTANLAAAVILYCLGQALLIKRYNVKRIYFTKQEDKDFYKPDIVD